MHPNLSSPSHQQTNQTNQTTPSTSSTLTQLRASLPEGWYARETLDGQIVFFIVEHYSSWAHPDPDVCLEPEDITPAQHDPQSEPGYEALSYTWGSITEPEIVRAFDPDDADSEPKRLSIGENLASGLRHLRLPDRPRALWIDFICIDQSNLEERSEQDAVAVRELRVAL